MWWAPSGHRSGELNTRSSSIALAPRIGRAIGLGRTARQADPRLTCQRSDRSQLFEEDRPREIVALGIADLGGGLQIGKFLERFDTLGDHGHAECLAQGFDRAEDA